MTNTGTNPGNDPQSADIPLAYHYLQNTVTGLLAEGETGPVGDWVEVTPEDYASALASQNAAADTTSAAWLASQNEKALTTFTDLTVAGVATATALALSALFGDKDQA